jgi:hypothetical protein
MNVVDSSCWIEYFNDTAIGSNAKKEDAFRESIRANNGGLGFDNLIYT